jgi:hypothetical protein
MGIIIKNSFTAGFVPLPSDIEVGELFTNLADELLFTKNEGGQIITVYFQALLPLEEEE